MEVAYDDSDLTLHGNLEMRQRQIQIRISDLEAMIEYILQAEGQESEIILVGHSFGGATCAYVASRNASNKIKGCALLDPWFFTIQDKIEKR